MEKVKVFVPLAEGFEEIEAITVIDVLRRAGIRVDTAGAPGVVVTGAHGVKVWTDKKLNDIQPEEYDGIILPGGDPGYKNLARMTNLTEWIKKMNEQKKLIAAICASPLILARAGILENRKATIYPGMETEIPYPRGDRVVIDGNIITSQGPGTAMEFALKIVEMLVGGKKAAELRKALVV